MEPEQTDPEETSPELAISPETVFYIIVKAREFDVEVAPSGLEAGSNPSDDKEVGVLESGADDATPEELKAALGALNEDQQLDLLGLLWLGRGDYASFAEARQEAADMREKHIPSYLIGTPQLGDYLEEGLSQLGYALDEFEINRL